MIIVQFSFGGNLLVNSQGIFNWALPLKIAQSPIRKLVIILFVFENGHS